MFKIKWDNTNYLLACVKVWHIFYLCQNPVNEILDIYLHKNFSKLLLRNFAKFTEINLNFVFFKTLKNELSYRLFSGISRNFSATKFRWPWGSLHDRKQLTYNSPPLIDTWNQVSIRCESIFFIFAFSRFFCAKISVRRSTKIAEPIDISWLA
jgi:hypothetical protein